MKRPRIYDSQITFSCTKEDHKRLNELTAYYKSDRSAFMRTLLREVYKAHVARIKKKDKETLKNE